MSVLGLPNPTKMAILQDFFGNGIVGGITSGLSSLTPLQFSKSIHQSYRFYVSFIPDFLPDTNKKLLYMRIGYPPLIRSWHVTSIDLPTYKFDKDVTYYGPVPRAIPKLDFDGFEVKIEFEEDANGTIAYFINWLQRSLIDKKGLYTPPNTSKIPLISVITEDDVGVPTNIYTLHDCFFLGADNPVWDYSKAEAVKYGITFSVDRINSFQPKAWATAQATGILTGV